MAGGPKGATERTRRILEVAVPVGLGAVLTVLNALGVMNSSYAAAAILGVLGIIGYGQIGRDRQAADHVDQLGRQLSAVLQAFDGVSELQFYNHHELFYAAITQQVSQAKEELLVSYFRRYSPDELASPAVHAYFTACKEWVLAAPTHQLRRLVTSENAPGLTTWKDAQRELALKHRARYLVRLVDVQGDALSVAIIDREQVFFTVGTDPHIVTGFSLRSAKLGEYLSRYHQSLWDKGRDITVPAP